MLPSQRQIESIEDWVGVWQNQQGMRERLFAMATFWNESSQEERHTVFSRFLAVISGSGKGVTGEDFPAEQMVCLPMDNYEDLTFPDQWLDFFRALEPEQKLEAFEQMYLSATSDEQNMIVKDLRFFMMPETSEAAQIAVDEVYGGD